MNRTIGSVFAGLILWIGFMFNPCYAAEDLGSEQHVGAINLPPIEPGVLKLIAGNTEGVGSKDAVGRDAQFGYATSEIGGINAKGIASDASNNLYVADAGNHTIRKISPDGLVTTIAGKAGVHGCTDGVGSDARFYYPSGIAVDTQGNLYVSDSANHTIRKITPDGNVSTMAGKAGLRGHVDGQGPEARFSRPKGIAVNKGIVYVADSSNSAIRVISPEGNVTTVAGENARGFFAVGSSSLFDHPSDVMVYPKTGEVFVADTGHNAIRIIRSTSVATWFAGKKGDIDGKFATAHIDSPTGLGMDDSGIYV